MEFQTGSQTVLDVFEDIILLKLQNFLIPDRLFIGRLPQNGEESSTEWSEISIPAEISEFEGLTQHYMELTAPDVGDEISNSSSNLKYVLNSFVSFVIGTFNTIYIGPESSDEKEVPFIVYPHDGPHNSFVNKFSIEIALFASMGISTTSKSMLALCLHVFLL